MFTYLYIALLVVAAFASTLALGKIKHEGKK